MISGKLTGLLCLDMFAGRSRYAFEVRRRGRPRHIWVDFGDFALWLQLFTIEVRPPMWVSHQALGLGTKQFGNATPQI